MKKEKQQGDSGLPVQSESEHLDLVPWFLLLGDADAGQAALLRAVTQSIPLLAPLEQDPLGTQCRWHWWMFERLAAIETPAGLLRMASASVYQDLWDEDLQLLQLRHVQTKFKGLIVLVSAPALRGSKSQLHDYSSIMQRRVSAVAMALRSHLPVYIIVTRCERLSGFSDFVEALPLDAVQQALGFQPGAESPSKARLPLLPNKVFDAVHARLQSVQADLLWGAADPVRQEGVAGFVEAFQTLGPGLETLVNVLFDERNAPNVFWRGLYFVGTEHRSAFVHHLFSEILPRDIALVRRISPLRLMLTRRRESSRTKTGRSRRARRTTNWFRLIVIALLLGLGVGLSVVFGPELYNELATPMAGDSVDHVIGLSDP